MPLLATRAAIPPDVRPTFLYIPSVFFCYTRNNTQPIGRVLEFLLNSRCAATQLCRGVRKQQETMNPEEQFKTISLVGILIITLVAGLAPLKLQLEATQQRKNMLGYFAFFTGGIFLGAGLLHMLPTSVAQYAIYDPASTASGYPTVYLAASLGFVLVWAIGDSNPDSAKVMVVATASGGREGASICYVDVEPVTTYTRAPSTTRRGDHGALLSKDTSSQQGAGGYNSINDDGCGHGHGHGHGGSGSCGHSHGNQGTVALVLPQQATMPLTTKLPINPIGGGSTFSIQGGGGEGNNSSSSSSSSSSAGGLSKRTNSSSMHVDDCGQDSGAVFRHTEHGGDAPCGHDHSAPGSVAHPKLHTHEHTNVRHRHVVFSNQNSLLPFILALLFSVHSFIAGLALGLQRSMSGSIAVLVAIVAHKVVEALVVGVNFSKEKVPTKTAYPVIATYALMTPLGIVVGMVIVSSTGAESSSGFAVQGLLQGVAAGSFLYLCMHEIAHVKDVAGRSFSPGVLVRASLFLAGLGFMALLAIWV